jgi:hypothetical protein
MISANTAKIGLLLIYLPAIYTSFFFGKIVLISIICFYPILLYFIFNIKNFYSKDEFDNNGIFLFFYFINIISLIRGYIDLESKQDFTVFTSWTIFVMILYPLFIYLSKINSIINIFRSFILIGIPLSFFTFNFIPTDGFSSFLQNISFIYLFIFFIPFVKMKWKLIIIILCITIPFYDLTRRSALVNLIFSFSLIFLYYFFPYSYFLKVIKFLFYILIISPFIFLFFGLSGIFNVFSTSDYLNDYTIKSKYNERNAFTDSRTSIYKDVFFELGKKNAFIFGLGGNGKTNTSLKDDQLKDYEKIYKEGRRYTESGMLNQFQFNGFFGALSYWLLLTFASYNAIFKSNNLYFKLLGSFMSFKVFYSFIEDPIYPNVASFYLMFMIGMSYNFKLRSLNNIKIKKLSNFIFQ